MTKDEEFNIKLNRIRSFMNSRGYDAVFYAKQYNFSWLSCGGDNQILHGVDEGFVYFLITWDNVYLVTNNIEMPRIADEEVVGLDIEKIKYPWTEDIIEKLLKEMAGDKKVASDIYYPAENITYESVELDLLRAPLTDSERKRYRTLAGLCETSINEAVKEIKPGMSEYEIQGIVGERLLSKGVFPLLLLVGSDERIFKYRHPMPTSKKLDRYCMIVICAQKWGLVLNMTRLLHFGKLPDEIFSKYRALQKVDMAYITSTKPGKKLKEVFNAGKEMYAEVGYPGEEKRHFQGGTCGYLAREQILSPYSEYIISDGEIFAHNPTITGTKIEDSIMIKDGSYEVLTLKTDWPSKEIEYKGIVLKRPEILVV